MALLLLLTIGLSIARTSLGAQAQLRTLMKQGKEKEPTQLTPAQWLLISSPMEKKICYTALKDFKASPTGAVSPLIDAGLMNPQGIAVDKVGGHLYVADMDAGKIFRYQLAVKDGKLLTTGIQLTVVTGKIPRWVTVDMKQNLYYSEPENGAVNKLDAGTIARLANGEITADELVTRQEKEEEALKTAEAQAALAKLNVPPTAPPDPKPEMLMLYQRGANDHVVRPSGIATNGVNVYWGNEASGTSAGAVVAGDCDPVAPATSTGGDEGEGAFSSVKLASNTNKVFGVCLTHSSVVYTDAARSVYGVGLSGGPVGTFTDQLEAPRGLVWDGDGTIYVADQAASAVLSFPSGKLGAAQMTRVTTLHDAFGLALLTEEDGCFKGINQESKGATMNFFWGLTLAATAVLGA